MFIGHYSVALLLKVVDKKVSLGLLFLAVQFVDLIFFPLTLLGIESFLLIENFTESTHFKLVYMPFSHSLVASTLWGILAFIILTCLVWKNSTNRKLAVYIGLAVLSHWFLDLIVHTPDLPLFTDSGMKVGFGLWNNAVLTYLIEAIVIIAGLVLYLRTTHGETKVGRFGMIVFIGLLLLLNIVNIFGPLSIDDTQVTTAISAIISYLIFAFIAHCLDKKRV